MSNFSQSHNVGTYQVNLAHYRLVVLTVAGGVGKVNDIGIISCQWPTMFLWALLGIRQFVYSFNLRKASERVTDCLPL